ncbi:hypothetical protein ONA70_31165 [Micromonospora yasonensis]|uniref:hypothetical protein n=1 Tax=Micromonospora yasonensis TaxID=1128667 RepID=UPI00222F9E92|nr:hypothetical protein [Micromonospora yasonensis]MCW3844549.1 hypothetical protein [Micromonospora yasonensis]
MQKPRSTAWASPFPEVDYATASGASPQIVRIPCGDRLVQPVGDRVQVVTEQPRVHVQGHRRRGAPEHPLHRLDVRTPTVSVRARQDRSIRQTGQRVAQRGPSRSQALGNISAEYGSYRSRRRRPGPGLLATSGRHRPGRPATLAVGIKGMKG